MSLDDPKIFVARADLGGVLVCGVRATDDGLDGPARARGCRRSGFAIVLLNFLPISYFVDDEPHASS